MADWIRTTVRLRKDLYDKLEKVKDLFGSSHNFQINEALDFYFRSDIRFKKIRQNSQSSPPDHRED